MKLLYKGMKALRCINDEYFIGYKKCGLYKCYLNKNKIEYLCELPLGAFGKVCSGLRFIERAAHLNPRTITLLDEDNILIGINRKIYRLSIASKKIICEHTFIDEMSSPLMFARIEGIKGFQDSIVYGEYTNKIEKHTVSIYSRGLNIHDKWEKRYTFKNGLIQHIHGFIPDFNRCEVIIMTGDYDHESGFWRAEKNFSNVEAIITGSQDYRTCVGMLSNCKLIYATDNPFRENYIYEFDFCQNHLLKKLEVINGTVINGIVFKNKLYISTTVESVPYTKKWQMFLPRKLAKGVKNRSVDIISCDVDGKVNKVSSFEKDSLYMPLFQYGMVEFCQTDGNRLLCNPIAVRKYDNCVIDLEVE